MPIAAAVSVTRSRPGLDVMTRVVAEMGTDVPGTVELRESLRRSTSDPTIEVLRLDSDHRSGAFSSQEMVEDPDGRRATITLRSQGEVIGLLRHDSALKDSPEVLRAVQRMASLVLENEQLLERTRRHLQEVAASRKRIVEVGDAERLRIERNMHDGVQQRLVAASLLLRRSERSGGPTAGELLHRGVCEIDTALVELREIVRGVHPPLIAERGFVGAIHSIAERSSVAVTVEAGAGVHEVSASTAITAYYVVAEAVANAEKHSRTPAIEVGLAIVDESLVLSVDDEGVGGAAVMVGGGLAGLGDRVDAYGGTLCLQSPLDGGTHLRVTLPVDDTVPQQP